MNTTTHFQCLITALQAICARIDGTYDDPSLLSFGPLGVSTTADCRRIASSALRGIPESETTPPPDATLSAAIPDPGRQWESPQHAIDFCMSHPQPIEALKAIVCATIDQDETGFAWELIRDFPDGPLPGAEQHGLRIEEDPVSIPQEIAPKRHTPGPLTVSRHATPEHSPQFGIYAEGQNHDFAIVKGDNAEADATLFAAAPQLLMACQKLVTWLRAIRSEAESLVIDHGPEDGFNLTEAEAIIAEATNYA